jgi:hypothetical protein
MAVGVELGHRMDEVTGRYQVVREGEDGRLPIQHGIGSRGLFSIMNHCFRVKLPKDPGQKLIVTDIADKDLNPISPQRLPKLGSLVQIGRGYQGFTVQFCARPPPEIIVHYGDFMALMGQMHGGGPAQISISSQD